MSIRYATKYPTDSRQLPEDVVELENQLKGIVSRMEEAVANHDFAIARACSDEEREARKKLSGLKQRYGITDWVFD